MSKSKLLNYSVNCYAYRTIKVCAAVIVKDRSSSICRVPKTNRIAEVQIASASGESASRTDKADSQSISYAISRIAKLECSTGICARRYTSHGSVGVMRYIHTAKRSKSVSSLKQSIETKATYRIHASGNHSAIA